MSSASEASASATLPPIYAGLPDAPLPTALPSGWSTAGHEPLQLIGPEKDLTLTFLVLPTQPNDQLLAEAWKQASSGLELRERQQAQIPSTHGWDNAFQVVYDCPAADGSIALAMIRTLGDRCYINLVVGTKASLSRRGAQLADLIQAWRPSGLQEPSLAGTPAHSFGAAQQDALRTFVVGAMRDLAIPGIAIALVQRGHTVFAEGFGLRSIDAPEPVTPNTRFMIGSTTKSLTSFLTAALVDRGYFDWETPVTSILPNFALGDPETTTSLRMRHTLSASTGMPRRDLDLIFHFKGVTAEDRLAEMREMSPTTAFGETFQYSNYLVAAGGYAAAHSFAPEATLATAYERALQQLVFTPLAMTSTTVHAAPGENASPHSRSFEGTVVPIDPVMEQFADAVAPAGSVWSTVLDLAEYLKCELSGGLNSSGDRVISSENLLLRRQPGIRITERSSYGLGLILAQQQGIDEVSHGGNTIGFTSDMLFLPEHGIGYAVLTNRGYANNFLSALHQRLLELLFDATPRAEAIIAAAVLSSNKLSETLAGTVQTNLEDVGWVSALGGDYTCPELGPAHIAEQAGRYSIAFQSWSSDLGVASDAGERQELVLTSAPWRGTLRLRADPETGSLVLDGGQTKYTFARTSPPVM